MDKCNKCEKKEAGNTRTCPYDEEFNKGTSETCNCCESCRRECLYDI